MHYRELIDLSPDAVIVHADDAIICANAAAASLFGAANPGELEGCPLSRFLPSRPRENQWGASDPSSFLEFRLKRFDGSYRVIEATSTPVIFDERPVTQVVARDVTARKEAAELLRRSERQYRSLFDNTLDAVFISTTDGSLVDINPAGVQLLGYDSKDHIVNTSCLWDGHMKAADRTHLIATLVDKGIIKDFEYILTRRNGQRRVVLESASAVHDEHGNVIAYQRLIRDVTEHRHLEQQLSQAQKMESIGILVSGIAHDFNNILNNINGFVSQLQKYPDDPSRVMRYSATIEKSTSRGVALATQLLSFVRHRQREDTATRAQEIINDIVLLLHETFPKNIVVETHIDEALSPVMGDRGELYQAFLNICLNARDAMPDGGELLIDARNCTQPSEAIATQLLPDTPYIKISVKDTGIGIPEGAKERIFDPFFTTKERTSGTGLGLSIVYNIIRSHKGHIIVDSEDRGGTAFHVYLPAVEQQLQTEFRDGSSTPPRANNELILLVDDEIAMQELGKELLEEEGFNVMVASNGLEAIDLYSRYHQKISLVILDLLMPKMDGGKAYLELRKINQAVKAFFCTGYTSDEVIGSLLRDKNLRVLQKPFRPSEFVKTVREVLQG